MISRTIYTTFFCLLFSLITITPYGDIPRPEHPFPQMVRSEWLNLNGVWDYAETNDSSDESFLTLDDYPEEITVPFCRESSLSGIQRTDFMKNVWYRRTFKVPSNWKAERVLLHVEASDWISRVWVNGMFVGDNEGGYSRFSFDISDQLVEGDNTIIIHAFDDSAGALQPLGKQSIREKSFGIFYTRTTGIWQTVWLEGVAESFIEDVRMTPDPDNSRIILQPEINGPADGLTIHAVAMADGKKVGSAKADAVMRNNYLVVDLSEKHLWSVDDPFLYDLKLSLTRGDKLIDKVDSYFGLRKVDIEGAAILINDEPVFQRLVLDQGFFPDGIWTAPTDEALKNDILLSKSVGFNGARLHQKVFEPRFLYWADKLGYLVWGEFPSYGADYGNPVVNRPWINEWVNIVRRDRNHPSIIGWCPFNETPGEAGDLQNTVHELTKIIDPTRPLIDTSGWVHSLPDPEVLDAHDYNQNAEELSKKWIEYFNSAPMPQRYGAGSKKGIPFYISEFGGIGWFPQTTEESWGYGNQPKTLDEFYARFKGLVDAQLDNPNFFGYCYTQLTDIEQEKNGVFFYDRTPKFDAEKLHAIQSRKAAYEKNPPVHVKKQSQNYNVLLGAAPDGDANQPWQYTTQKPADAWMNVTFDDSGWKTGKGGFGTKGDFTNTRWTSKDIWLRREFDYDGKSFESALLVTHYDNETHVYVNGELIWNRNGWNDSYAGFDITKALKGALKKGKNTIAIHCHQDDGGQFIDAAILTAN